MNLEITNALNELKNDVDALDRADGIMLKITDVYLKWGTSCDSSKRAADRIKWVKMALESPGVIQEIINRARQFAHEYYDSEIKMLADIVEVERSK